MKGNHQQSPVNPDLPEIMGKPKPVQRHVMPTSATKRQSEKKADIPDNFEAETNEAGFVEEIPQEGLVEDFGIVPNFEDEEEEGRRQGLPGSDNGFATGITFDELTIVGALLEQDVLESALQQKTINIVRRIQGTELFSLLENSMEEASRKIAELLDKRLPTGTDFSSFNLRNKDLEGFDIGEFV